MKRMYMILMINTVAVIVFVLGFLVVYGNTALQKQEDYIFNQVVTLKNQVIIENAPVTQSYQIVMASYDAYNRDDSHVGTVYELHIKNGYIFDKSKGYGSIKLYLGVDHKDKMYAHIFELEQTSIYHANIVSFVKTSLRGITLDTLESTDALDAAYDLETGATATDSTSSLLDLVIKAAQIHFDLVEEDPWLAFFNEGYYKQVDEVKTTQSVIVYNVLNEGYVYDITASGFYEGYDDRYEGSITLQVFTQLNGIILGVIPVEGKYFHTLSYFSRNKTYIEGLIGLHVNDIEGYLGLNDDLKTGATGTKELIEDIFRILVREVISNG